MLFPGNVYGSDARLRATLGDALPQTDLSTALRAELERLRERAA